MKPRALEHRRDLVTSLLRERRVEGKLEDSDVVPLPKASECFTAERGYMGTPGHPCPYLSCKWHLKSDVGRGGSERPPPVLLVRPEVPLEEEPVTCSRWLANHAQERASGWSTEAIAGFLGISQVAVRGILHSALAKLGVSEEQARELLAPDRDGTENPTDGAGDLLRTLPRAKVAR